jgi:hypothetical protein
MLQIGVHDDKVYRIEGVTEYRNDAAFPFHDDIANQGFSITHDWKAPLNTPYSKIVNGLADPATI